MVSSVVDFSYSLWCDFVERDFLEGEFRELLKRGVINGATSNPAIFEQSISNSISYKEDIKRLKGKNPKEIYEELALSDIKRASEILMPYFKKSNDGFISIEVDPFLSQNSSATLDEALRIYDFLKCENVMIKIPATNAGYGVMSELIKRGISVNATLIFSPSQALQCLDAFESGFFANSNAKAVISIFVSRFDRLLDDELSKLGVEQGRVGVLNAQKIYNMIRKRDIKNTRALFASTGVKGDRYKKEYYISELLLENSINTAPLKTIEAFLESKDFKRRESISDDKIDEFFKILKYHNIDMQKCYDTLLDDGIRAFEESFKNLLAILK